jgi:hypothetical protein
MGHVCPFLDENYIIINCPNGRLKAEIEKIFSICPKLLT